MPDIFVFLRSDFVSVTAPRAERTAPSAPWTSAPVSVPAEKTTSPESAPRPFVPAIPPERLKLTEDLPGQTTVLETKEAPWRIAGEVLRTYIICESEDGSVWLIDKHAAHERMNFDKLKNAQEPPMRQTLLAPIAAELSREDGALLLENLPLLEQFGFACEDFGAGALLVRDGLAWPITWEREGESDRLSFYREDGQPAALGVGHSYINIVKTGTEVTWAAKSPEEAG